MKLLTLPLSKKIRPRRRGKNGLDSDVSYQMRRTVLPMQVSKLRWTIEENVSWLARGLSIEEIFSLVQRCEASSRFLEHCGHA